MKSLLSLLFVAFLYIAPPLFAQSNETPIDSLSDQLFKSSNRYTEGGIVYRVVKWETLSQYFKNVKELDSRKSDEIVNSEATIATLKEEQKSQLAAYAELNAKYNHAVKVNDAMEIFSLLIPKKKYNMIMWSLIAILIGLAVILYLMYIRGLQTTRLAKKELEEKTEEFENYRKRTLKREQEVASGYLRDIKKLKEQLGKI